MILQCALCHHTGLDVESRIVADESPLGYHREPRCVDLTSCEERILDRQWYCRDCFCWHDKGTDTDDLLDRVRA